MGRPQDVDRNIINDYNAQYVRLDSFFQYLKARLTLDFSRLIRRGGMSGKVSFSIRIKTFPSILEKLRRHFNKHGHHYVHSNLLDLICHEQNILKDVVGIRIICFDQRNIVTLLHHLLQHNSIRVSPQEFYQSVLRYHPNDELRKFLVNKGFSAKALDESIDSFRRYEDINMYLFFQNIRDYDPSYRTEPKIDPNSSFERQRDNWHRTYINRTWSQDIGSDVQESLPKFPIEAQIMTMGMYIFNEIQRPAYLTKKLHVNTKSHEQSIDMYSEFLESLKMSLVSAEKAMEGLTVAIKGDFSHRAPIRLMNNYDLGPRIPRDIDEIKDLFFQVNYLAGQLVDDVTIQGEFVASINQLLDRSKYDTLGTVSLKQLIGQSKDVDSSYPYFSYNENVDWWILNRLLLMIFAIVAGYSRHKEPIQYIAERSGFADDIREAEYADGRERVWDGNVLMRRIYDHVSEIDHFCEQQRHEDKEVLHYVIDPLVKWRQATAYYQMEDFTAAEKRIEIGLELVEKREKLDLPRTRDQSKYPMYPEKVEFERRRIEYRWCKLWVEEQGDGLAFTASSAAELISQINLIIRPALEESTSMRLHAYKILLSYFGMTLLIPEISEREHTQTNDQLTTGIAQQFLKAIEEYTIHRESYKFEEQNGKIWWLLSRGFESILIGEFEEANYFLKKSENRLPQVNWHPRSRLAIYEWYIGQLKSILDSVTISENFESNDDSVKALLQQIPSEVKENICEVAKRARSFKKTTPEERGKGINRLLAFGERWNHLIASISSHHAVIREVLKLLP